MDNVAHECGHSGILTLLSRNQMVSDMHRLYENSNRKNSIVSPYFTHLIFSNHLYERDWGKIQNL